ncbi:MAG: ApaG domain [Comamonadaceae bacterium]|nr:ApaG domain [Comamonadaceae bacterium]
MSHTITLRNTGRFMAHLIAHTVNVDDANGCTGKVKGLAFSGHQPLPQPGQTVATDRGTQAGPGMAGQPDAPGSLWGRPCAAAPLSTSATTCRATWVNSWKALANVQ